MLETTTNTGQQPCDEADARRTLQLITGNVERYPRLTMTVPAETTTAKTTPPPTVQGRQGPGITTVNQLRRKPVGKASSLESLVASQLGKMPATPAASDGAALKKPRNFSLPRQTRTSSLRAQISAGTLSSEGNPGPKAPDVVDSSLTDAQPELAQPRSMDMLPVQSPPFYSSPPQSSFGDLVHSHWVHPVSTSVAGVTTVTSDAKPGSTEYRRSSSIPLSAGLPAGALSHASPTESSLRSHGGDPLVKILPAGASVTSEAERELAPHHATNSLPHPMRLSDGSPQSASDKKASRAHGAHPPARAVSGIRRGSRGWGTRFSGRQGRGSFSAATSRSRTSNRLSGGTASTSEHPEVPALRGRKHYSGGPQSSLSGKHGSVVPSHAHLSTETGVTSRGVPLYRLWAPAAEDSINIVNEAHGYGLSSGTTAIGINQGVGAETNSGHATIGGSLTSALVDQDRDSTIKRTESEKEHGYKVKRLSKISPENGPTLLISSSARRVIMGRPEVIDENEVASVGAGNMKEDVRGMTATKELRQGLGGTRLPFSGTNEPRPRSTCGDLWSRIPRQAGTGLTGKRVRSAEAKLLFSRVDNDPFTDQNQPLRNRAASSVELSNEGAPSKEEKEALTPLDLTSGQSDDVASAGGLQGSVSPLVNGMMATSGSPQTSIPMPQESSIIHLDRQDRNESGRQSPHSSSAKPSGAVDHRDPAVSSSGFQTSSSYYPSPQAGSPLPVSAASGTPRPQAQMWPPRSSSRVASHEHKTPQTSSHMGKPKNIAPRLSRDFRLVQDKLGFSKDLSSTPHHLEDEAAKKTSHASKQSSSRAGPAKGMLSMSNIRGFFRKGSSHPKGEEKAPAPSSKARPKVSVSTTGSPFASQPDPHARPRSGPLSTSAGRRPSPLAPVPTLTDLPSSSPTLPSRVAETTSFAMQILDAARTEPRGPRKERLLEMGKIMVDVLTQVRDAEMAMEQAKVAAGKAEMAYFLTKKSMFDVFKMVGEWKVALDAEG